MNSTTNKCLRPSFLWLLIFNALTMYSSSVLFLCFKIPHSLLVKFLWELFFVIPSVISHEYVGLFLGKSITYYGAC